MQDETRLNLKFPKREGDINKLKTDFAPVFTGTLELIKEQPIKHKIRLEGVYKAPFVYPVPFAYEDAAKKRIAEMLEQGVIQRSESPYASPVVCVPKKNGTVRVCIDYRALNAITIPDRYTLPRIEAIKQRLKGKIFSTFDLKEGFNQVSIAKNDIEKTAVKTPWGLYEFPTHAVWSS